MAGGAAAERGTGAETLAAMAIDIAGRYDGAALKFKDGGDWKELSYEELGLAVRMALRRANAPKPPTAGQRLRGWLRKPFRRVPPVDLTEAPAG